MNKVVLRIFAGMCFAFLSLACSEDEKPFKNEIVYDGEREESNNMFISEAYTYVDNNDKTVTNFIIAITSGDVDLEEGSTMYFVGTGYDIIFGLIVEGEHDRLPAGKYTAYDAEIGLGVDFVGANYMVDNKYTWIGPGNDARLTIKNSGDTYTVELKDKITVKGEENPKSLLCRFKGKTKFFMPIL